MAKTLQTKGGGLSDASLRGVITELQSAIVDIVTNSPGLAIGSSSKKAVKIANTVYAMIDGVLVKKTTAEIALAGTVTNAKFNVFVLSMTANGTVVATMGTEGATIGALVFPAVPASSVVLGYVIVNPTGTGNFVGATTDLDDVTVAPNAVYINTVGAFNPNVLAL
jgi:hypothetical protein